MSGNETTLDPVTREVLRNAFSSIVDQMAEQLLRTCHSFVIYSQDFASALCDAEGETVAQGRLDLCALVGTLGFSAKATIAEFRDEMKPGDVYILNDPYVGGTHHNDVRVIRPIFYGDTFVGCAQCSGHWSDIGGSVPGSMDVTQRDHFALGMRLPPLKIWDGGDYREDVVRMISTNTRGPEMVEGDLHAQAEATRIAETEIHRYIEKYGLETVTTAFREVQDYVERLARQRIAELPDGTWENVDYLDFDPDLGEGLIPVRVKMTIDGDQIRYDLSGSHPSIASVYNCSFGTSFSAVVGATKLFFPDLPLNAGFYRAIDFDPGPEGSVVNAVWPTATASMVMPYEKVMNAIIEIWSQIMPERAMACSFNIEYLLTGGRDARWESKPMFMWYDWLAGGWGGRHDRDGVNATSAVFGPGLAIQAAEPQERMNPVVIDEFEILPDSGGPGRFRGGCGLVKSARLTDVESTVISYICDRERSIVWGTQGGLPSLPHGLWIERDGEERESLGAVFANEPVKPNDYLTRPSAGGGGYGDPLERDVDRVCEDVIDGYVTIDGARRDYGVVVEELDADLGEYRVDHEATAAERKKIREQRRGWLEEDPESVAARYRSGELDQLDLVRRYGVIVDWGTGEVLTKSTETYREVLRRRAAAYWVD